MLRAKSHMIVSDDAQPISQHAYDLLVEQIITLKVKPGSALREKSLMEQLDIGRTPIREALHRLTAEGLVCRTPHRGVYVCEVTSDSIRQVAEFRRLIDGPMARMASERATGREIEILGELSEALEKPIEARDFDAYVNLSRMHYYKLARSSQNIHFEETAPRIYNFDARLLYLAAGRHDQWLELARSRAETARMIVECMLRRAGAEAEMTVGIYLLRYYEDMMERLA